MAQRHAQPTQTTQQHDQEAKSGGRMQDEQQTTVMTGAAAAAAPSADTAAAASVDPQTAQPAVVATAAAASAGSKRKGAGSGGACSEEPLEGSNQPSSSPAAASASILHLAPVEAEPGSKRAKPTPPSPDATRILNSPMMRLLGRDSGARQSLMEMLTLAEFAAAHRVSRTWVAWTAESVRGTSVTLNDGSLVGFSQSRWLHHSVQCVEWTTPRWANAVCVRLFTALSQCIRFRSLTITLSRFAVGSPHLSAGFSSVASTLQHLRINVGSSQTQDSILKDFFSAVGALQQLRSLVIESIPAGECCTGWPWDLSSLALLPHLERFSTPMVQDACSPAQVESLSQCLQLTHLDFISWLYSGKVSISVRAQEAFATLMRRRKENGAAPFRRLRLGNAPAIRPENWQTLAQCTELEEIDAHWSCTLTAADWSRLSAFQRLESLSIRREGQETGVLDLSPVLSALMHCPRLRCLTLQGEFALGPTQTTLIAQLPALQVLCCSRLYIESLDSLSSAPALTELQFEHCRGPRGEPINVRELIPPMALVRKLTIADYGISWEQAALCAIALLERLPRLTRQQLHDAYL